MTTKTSAINKLISDIDRIKNEIIQLIKEYSSVDKNSTTRQIIYDHVADKSYSYIPMGYHISLEIYDDSPVIIGVMPDGDELIVKDSMEVNSFLAKSFDIEILMEVLTQLDSQCE